MSSANERITRNNQNMVKFAPELASKYAKWPIQHERWCETTEADPEGKPIFIPGSKGPLKMDYVYCSKGPVGTGYYHLLNRIAYVNLYNRLRNEAPSSGCCNKAARKNYDEFDDVKTIVYNRAVASKPDDSQAAKDAIKIAQGTADSVYNFTQDLQLVQHVVIAAA